MSRRGWLLFVSMCLIWGVPYLLIRVAVRDLGPASLVLFRSVLAALLLVPIAAVRGEIRPVLHRWRPLLAFAAVEIAVPWLLLAHAEQHVSSSLSGLLIAAVPLVGAAIARTTGARQRMGLPNLIGLLLGVLGVAAVVGLDLGGANLVGLLEIGGVVLGYAVGPVILASSLSGLPALGVLSVSLAASAVAYAPIAAFSLPSQLPHAKVVASVLTLAVVCTAVAFVAFFALIAEVGPVRATVITYVNPAVAAVLGVSLLGERFTAGMAVGFALILAGSILATRAGAEQARLLGEAHPRLGG
jgi:drug/metabolite transporter (DMT)-like permease